jgi:hypothetical protein
LVRWSFLRFDRQTCGPGAICLIDCSRQSSSQRQPL